MSEPSEAAYEEAARASWERAKALWPQGPDRYVELMLMRPDFRALVDTVWALARRQAAADIRTHSPTGERAARIAEGTAGLVTFVHPCGWSQVSPIPHLCPQCGTAEPWS